MEIPGYRKQSPPDTRGEWGGKAQGVRSITGRYKVDGEVKNSIGNVEAKELMCMTHGHELRGRECWREGKVQSGGE